MSIKLPSISSSKQSADCPIKPKCIESNNAFFKHNLLKNYCSPNQVLCFRLPKQLFYKKYCLLLVALVFVMVSSAQTTAPYAVNIAGNQASVGNFNLEWSVGESAAITTMGNSNLLVTNGLLQYNVENQSESNKIGIFLPNEIKVYPSPVKNILDINILHANKGAVENIAGTVKIATCFYPHLIYCTFRKIV